MAGGAQRVGGPDARPGARGAVSEERNPCARRKRGVTDDDSIEGNADGSPLIPGVPKPADHQHAPVTALTAFTVEWLGAHR